MLKLYHLPISFNSRRVWVALLEKGLEFELIELTLGGDQLTPEFLALNPFHHIPVLVDEDFSVFESLAILDYLEAKYPNPSLLPTEPQDLAIVRMVELVTVNEFLPATTPLTRKAFGFGEISDEQQQKSVDKIETVLTLFEQWLGESSYFIGETLTLADIVAGTAIPLASMLGISLDKYPRITAWIQRLMSRESWSSTEPQPEQIEEFKATMKKMMAKQS